jgi:hypothetical protein
MLIASGIVAIVVICVLIAIVVDGPEVKDFDATLIWVGAIITMVVLSLVFLGVVYSTGIFRVQETRTLVTKTKLYSLNYSTGTTIKGGFFLACGSFSSSSDEEYQYAANLGNNVYQVQRLSSRNAHWIRLSYTNSSQPTPMLIRYRAQDRYRAVSWLPHWLSSGLVTAWGDSKDGNGYTLNPNYLFWVPKGTIQGNFSVNLKQ